MSAAPTVTSSFDLFEFEGAAVFSGVDVEEALSLGGEPCAARLAPAVP
jgi:hypothetical protein